MLAVCNCADAAECHDSCLVQPAVCPDSAAQAGWVICQALQHSQQAGLWPLQQGHWWRLVRHACKDVHVFHHPLLRATTSRSLKKEENAVTQKEHNQFSRQQQKGDG
jgi:hypothetical protein